MSQGDVVITATKKSAPEFFGEFKFEIYDPNAENIGVNLIYNIGTASMKDKTTYNPHNNHLEQSTGRLRDPSDVDSYDEIDETVTELWAYNNYANITWRAFEMDSALLSPSPSDYPKGSFYALKLRVPVKGTYDLNIETYPFTVGCEADIYLVPKGDMENITLNDVKDIEPIGTVTSADFENRTQTAGTVEIERGGEFFILLKLHSDNKYLTNTGRHYFSLRKIIFKAATGPFDHVDMAIETLDGEGDELYFNAYRKLSYTLRDEFGNVIDGFNPDLVEINDVYLTKGEDVAKIVFENGNYYVETWDAAGEAEVALDLTYRGKNVTETFAFSVSDIGKKGRTLYTDEMVSAARENISKYSWARSEKESAVKLADKYLEKGLDFLWYSVTSNGVPRTYHVGIEGDAYEYVCRYCRRDLYALGHGNYPFNVDPLKNPWKITCPECSRSFPSNDFASFYELGCTQENGAQFDRITALEAHRAMLIEKGLMSDEAIAMTSPGEDCSNEWYLYYGYGVEGGYLHNDLYPEIGSESCPVLFDENIETVERWGVDDSMGYNTGKKHPNGIEEIHTYIGFYNHFAHFYIKNETLYLNALNNLSKAYLYTGDKKYGRAGAILIDRLADIYPTYDLNIYLPRFTNINGGSIAGKAIGKIWECYVAEYLANAYDAFWPMFEDPEVIEFLNEKAVYYGLENDKSTATKIRQNIEDGICREIYETTLTSQLNGNFGLNQLAVANAAIALDHKNDTAEMLAWLYKSKWTNDMSYNTGGEISERLVDVIYRDGQNFESPSYNNLGVTDFIKVAESLARYKANGGEFNEIPILEHPKYLKLINSFQTLTLVRRGVKALADSGQPGYYNKFPDRVPIATAFYYTKDSENPEVREEAIKMAQHLYMQQGKNLKNHHFDIWTRNPEALYDEVMDIIEEHGEYPYDKSSIMTGYGFAALRDGALYDTVGVSGVRDTTRDFTIFFSGHSNHQHHDPLDLGIEAYGIGLTMELGYPETALAGDPHTAQWSSTILAHNTVMVDEGQPRRPTRTSEPSHHFDAKDTRVKVLDTEIAKAYDQVDEYRRTIVMVDYDDEVSYGVDFFRVDGGKDHVYTFSPNSNYRPEHSDNISFVKQVDDPQDDWIYDDNHYPFSSYAGPDVQFGWDPYTDMSKVEAPKKFPLGYTWMFNVERADNPGENEFWLDYAIDPFNKEPSRNANVDVRLRVTMLNDFDADEISLVSHKPQRVKENERIGDLEKFLIRRKGERLDSLFTTVYEPYKEGDRYVTDIQSETLTVEKIAGAGTDKDVVKAVKVVLDDDRTDYIVYASNKNNTYRITDGEYSFEFSGFVGVWTVNGNGENIYSYLNDGTELGEGANKVENAEAVITGTVVDFQKELSLDNWIDVEFDRDLTEEEAEDLVDRMMNIERTTPGNSSYVIEGITMTDARNARINLNSTSLISNFVDVMDFSKGYEYNIAENQSFEIPMSYEMNGAPVFDAVEDKRVSVGSSITVTVNAVPVSEDLTVSYSARTLPRGAMFDAATGTFSWKPSTTQLGKNLVAIDAVDSMGRISTIYF
ncbi:MAG: heparinase II/III family protein, partial [Oscillospiraceae bacterium]|nr:heparinase II/III family protein [Oscillospiraceae bacterium]